MAGRSSKKVVYAALLGNVLVALTKFAAARLTGSSAMVSEAIHSLVDTGNEILLLYGLRRAARPPAPRAQRSIARIAWWVSVPPRSPKEVQQWEFRSSVAALAEQSDTSVRPRPSWP